MKKSFGLVVTLILAGSASLAAAQFGVQGNNLTGSVGWNYVAPALPPIAPLPQINMSTASPNMLLNNCDSTGCWSANGTRYTRAGSALFGSSGKICNIVAPGATAMCN